MGLSYLNKKSWHTGSHKNMENVWIADIKQKEKEQKYLEQRKKLKEEKQIEDLKRIQVEVGIIPASHLQRIDWMYQGPSQAQANNTDDFLMNNPIKDENLDVSDKYKKKIVPVIKESTANFDNETFTRMTEDPFVIIKREELHAKRKIIDNPVRMKEMYKKLGKLKEKKKSKKSKKEKREKMSKEKKEKSKKSSKNESALPSKSRKRKRSVSSESSNGSSSEEERYQKRKRKRLDSAEYSKLHKDDLISKDIPNKLQSFITNGKDSYGLILKTDEQKIKHTNKKGTKDLGPPKDIYEQKMREKEEEAKYKKKATTSYKYLIDEEKAKKLKEMTNTGEELQKIKLNRFEKENKGKEDKNYDRKDGGITNPKFIKDIQKDVYTDSSIDLADRLNRNAHYRERSSKYEKNAFRR